MAFAWAALASAARAQASVQTTARTTTQTTATTAQRSGLEAERDAKSEEQPATLETLVIASYEGVPLDYAGGRDLIDTATKEQHPDGNLETLFRRVPGVYYLPENGNDSRINIGLRGNDPRRSALAAVLVDGNPICEGPYGNTDIDGTPITPERIWQIDVIRGGGSVRYGPNSAGGVINLRTEPTPAAPMARFSSRIGENGDFAESIATGGRWGKLGLLASGVFRGGDGFRDNSEFYNVDGALKFDYALSSTETLSAYVSRFVEPGAEQPGGLTQAAYDADPSQSLRTGGDFSFDMNRYVLQYANRTADDSAFELKAWYQGGYRELNDYRPIVGPFTHERVQTSDFYSAALESAFSWSTEFGGVTHSFRHSVRYLSEMNDEFYYRLPIGGGPYVLPFELNAKFRSSAFSMFHEDLISLSDTVDFGVGFRVEDITMTGRSHDDGAEIFKNYTEVLPESTLTWRVRPRTSLYASFQQGFYPPQYETGFDPASVLYAPTQPESSDAYEIGARSREVDGLECSLALFDTEFHDKIDFINTPNGKVPINTGRARSMGVELGLFYDFGAATDSLEGLALYGSVTSLRSTIESGANQGNDTPNAPRLLASWGADYEHASSGMWARVGGSYSDESYKDLANATQGSADGLNGLQPAYTLWDAAVGWREHPDRTGLALSVGVTNLLDEDYFRRFSTGIFPGAPRQAFAVVSYGVSL